jgi:hypothetical protein
MNESVPEKILQQQFLFLDTCLPSFQISKNPFWIKKYDEPCLCKNSDGIRINSFDPKIKYFCSEETNTLIPIENDQPCIGGQLKKHPPKPKIMTRVLNLFKVAMFLGKRHSFIKIWEDGSDSNCREVQRFHELL